MEMNVKELAAQSVMERWRREIEWAVDVVKGPVRQRTKLDEWYRRQYYMAKAREKWPAWRKAKWLAWRRRQNRAKQGGDTR